MKILFLYVCIGKYVVFWKDFFLSVEKYVLTDCEKHYFVFTDSKHIFNENNARIHKIFQRNLGWPGNTLFRYDMFEKQIEKMKEYDYIFFMNANFIVKKTIGHELLPGDKLLAVKHPTIFMKAFEEYPYERNPESQAYIKEGEGEYYVCGGFNGGAAQKMIRDINKYTKEDYKKGIVAIYHDESHFNKYILTHEYKILGPEYAYPEEETLPFDCIALLRDKGRYGGHAWMRNEHISKKRKMLGYIKFLTKKFLG